ncbi:MAG: serine hydrolase [Anaerolineae bacterium]|nr:serine hydrolase [Anaerolineae bacterium]
MKSLKLWIVIIGLVAASFPIIVSGQDTGVQAEAVGQANLRATTDVNAQLVGQIASGTRYPVIGRSQFYPWLLLGEPTTFQPIGWVFADLVTVYGNINVVPFNEMQLNGAVSVTTQSPLAATQTDQPPIGVALPTATLNANAATATPISSTGVLGTVTGEINIRFGPGVEYPRIGVGRTGESFEITGRHTQLPWLQIRYPAAPNGYGWVANDLLDIAGNVFNVPTISQTLFDLPTLTATAPVVQAAVWDGATAVPLSPAFQQLGDQLWNMILGAGFELETSRLGALFVMDLQTGEAITFGNQIAFSGMSLIKIAILASLYSEMEVPPNAETAVDIANMMVCSENGASNALLMEMGDGNPVDGAQVVTKFLESAGLDNTYLIAPFLVPNATPAPVIAPTTEANQQIAAPDYSNQMTVDNMGWLLDGIYQCAFNNDGWLMQALPGTFDQRECRQMIGVMIDNNLGEPLLMSAGVPQNIQVAHKHGYINDTHGNAGIVFTPGGDYVLVVALHNPTWLEAEESFPLITDISRTVYNYFNPDVPMATPRESYIVPVGDCRVAGTSIVDELMSFE